ncbi:MAG: alpha/beta hydrolase, partial [Euryarchaeota archaeon]|nr:alpha/beta hydrolase [Euryarchaeota archaeon]
MKKTETEVATAERTPAPTLSVKVSDKDELDVWVVGEGVPVVLIHGAFFGSLLKPLAEQVAAQEGYQAIWYRRRGYNGKPTAPAPVPVQAQDVVKILDALGIDKAHVVGHSAGGVFALALAIEAPDRLLSAAFFDCILTQVPAAGMLADLAKPAIAKAQAGDFEGAAATFLAGLGVDQELMDERLPGSWSALTRDAPTWFQVDAPVINT